MVVRYGRPFLGKRFIGNKTTKTVHDTVMEKYECLIDEIPANQILTFSPDTLDEAKAQGYSPCEFCLWLE